MVKNRFHSILKKMQKRHAQILPEHQLIQLFLESGKKVISGAESQS
jgi:hypothetical protein